MNREEGREFWGKVARAFPDLNAWVMANSPEPAATWRSGTETLKGVPMAACELVLAKMVDGSIPLVEGYAKATTAHHIRRYATELVDSRKRWQEYCERVLQRQDEQVERDELEQVPYARLAFLKQSAYWDAARDLFPDSQQDQKEYVAEMIREHEDELYPGLDRGEGLN